MTRDDILRMAREAQLGNPYGVGDSASVYVGKEDILRDLERFAALVAAAEREACAKVAESYEPRCESCPSGVSNAILARGEI